MLQGVTEEAWMKRTEIPRTASSSALERRQSFGAGESGRSTQATCVVIPESHDSAGNSALADIS